MRSTAPRLLIAGTGSGCGKTTITCAILQALKNRGYDVASFKCGPDYIDPMFHSEIIGAKSANIDLFFAGEERARALFLSHASELNIIEGVMGYYDGLSMEDESASSHHVARALNAPAVLVVSGRGMGLSCAAVVRGYMDMRSPSGIKGVILNNVSPMSYPALKAAIERECGVSVLGFMPRRTDCALESRHLGLVTAQEVDGLREKMQLLAAQAEQSIDLDVLIALMRAQEPLEAEELSFSRLGDVRIAVAQDRAFCFYYRDNLELLERLGADLVYFSPLSDERLPACDGLLIGGGYPELYAQELAANRSMLDSIAEAVRSGLPTIAECGGFMLLTEHIAGHPMAGLLRGGCRDTKKLARFGYATFTAERDNLLLRAGESIRGHEFHYWDADVPGDGMTARKPTGREWSCAWTGESLYAGYPHLYLYSNPDAAKRFITKCLERKMRLEANGN